MTLLDMRPNWRENGQIRRNEWSWVGDFGAWQRRRGLRDGMVSRCGALLRRFVSAVDPATATAADVERWLDHDCNLNRRSRATYLSNLFMFFEWTVEVGVRDDNPVSKIPRPRLPRLLPRPAATFDLERAMRTGDARFRSWLALAAYQGFRCWEIAGLTREDVLDGHDPPLIMVTDGKGGKQRLLPLNPLALDALRAYGLPKHGHVFLLNDGRPMSAGTVSTYMSSYLSQAGVSASAHQFRHWFGVSVYAKTRDLRLTQELLGHSDPRTTAGYTAWSPGIAQDVVTNLGSHPEPPQPSLWDETP